MSGTHKAAICRAASAAAGRELQKMIDTGLTSPEQNSEAIAAHEKHVHAMTEIAAQIEDPSDDD